MTAPSHTATALRILVTGAHGLVGRSVASRLRATGMSVVGLDTDWASAGIPTNRVPSRPQTQCLHVDAGTREAVQLAREVGPFDAIVHAAGLTPKPRAQGAVICHMIDTAIWGTASMLEVALTRGWDCKFIYISSTAVYRRASGKVAKETDADGGHSAYGVAKRSCESLCRLESAKSGLTVRICRLTGVYSEAELPTASRPHVSLPSRVANCAALGELPKLAGSDSLPQDWLHVDDAAEAIQAVLLRVNQGWDTFDVGSGTLIPPHDVLALGARYAGIPLTAESPVPGMKRNRPALDPTQLFSTGWLPSISFEDGFARCYRAAVDSKSPAPLAGLGAAQ